MEWIRFVVAAALLITGIGTMVMATIGVYRFKYILNRMHAAAMGDSLGILFALLGLVVLYGFSFATLKLFLIILFFWVASPVSAHLISRLEAMTNEELESYCEVEKDDHI